MNITSNKSGGSGLINAPEFSGALDWTEKLLDELAMFPTAKGGECNVSVGWKPRKERLGGEYRKRESGDRLRWQCCSIRRLSRAVCASLAAVPHFVDCFDGVIW